MMFVIWDRSEIVLFRLFTREFVLLGGLKFVRSVVLVSAETDEFQTGPKFVRYRANGV
jgi:hypothetical protein